MASTAVCLLFLIGHTVAGGDFLIVSEPTSVISIDLETKTATPLITDLKTAIGIEFDLKNNCLFYADNHDNIIARKCLSGNQTVQALGNVNISSVEALAYDWISEHLYFIDAVLCKIEMISTAFDTQHPGQAVRREILSTGKQSKPRGLAIHPMLGYLFWTDWHPEQATIKRANLDGSNRLVLFRQPRILCPNDIAIDYANENGRICWVDGLLNRIACSNFDGDQFELIVDNDNRVDQPFSIVIYQNRLYWMNYNGVEIFSADKQTGSDISTVVVVGQTAQKRLKMVADSIQNGTNACNGNHPCSHFCVGAPDALYSCLCPNDLIPMSGTTCLCPGARVPNTNGTCPSYSGHCSSQFYECLNEQCVMNAFRCNGKSECRDHSDEIECKYLQHICPQEHFRCKTDGRCIPKLKRCNEEDDCSDGSDELDCPSIECDEKSSHCNSHLCIQSVHFCDGVSDCPNGIDEMNCFANNTRSICGSDSFHCDNDGGCIKRSWVCDGERDCKNGFDELNCELPSEWTYPENYSHIQPTVVSTQSTKIKLQWAPASGSNDVNYTIYHGANINEYSKSAQRQIIVRHEHHAILDHLIPCERYFLGVAIADRVGFRPSPPPQPIECRTWYDATAGPRDMRVQLNGTTMRILWHHNCHFARQHPSAYIINVTDLVINATTTGTVRSDRNYTHIYEFRNVVRGAKYSISVAAVAAGAVPSMQLYDAPSLPSPKQLWIRVDTNGATKINWDSVEFHEAPFKYEIILARDLNRNVSTKIASDIPSVQLSANDLMKIASSLGTRTLTVGVRIRTDSGHKSKIQRIERISINPISARPWSHRNIGALILIIVLIAYAVRRYYRICLKRGAGTTLAARYTRYIENSQQTLARINTNNNNNANHLDGQDPLLEAETQPQIE